MRWPWLPRNASGDARFGFAVVGLGHGATKFLEGLRGSPTVRVAALVSGDRAKAQALARAHRVPAVYCYDNFAQLADNPEVHAVYLCLPNALHREFTERAAIAGKHVLCEKPMAATVEQCERMVEACRSADRLLMMGYRLSFTAAHTKMRELLNGGVLGEVTAVRAGFGFVAKPGWRLHPALAGGGSLWDVGVYAVNTLHTLFWERFTVDVAKIERDPATGLEVSATWQGALWNGATLHCRSSFVEKIPDFFGVETVRATLMLKPAFSYGGLHLRVRAIDPGDAKELNLDLGPVHNEPSAFRLEAEHMAECVATGLPLRTPGEDGLRDLRVLAAIERLANVSTVQGRG